METSAKSGMNIELAFEAAARFVNLILSTAGSQTCGPQDDNFWPVS